MGVRVSERRPLPNLEITYELDFCKRLRRLDMRNLIGNRGWSRPRRQQSGVVGGRACRGFTAYVPPIHKTNHQRPRSFTANDSTEESKVKGRLLQVLDPY